MRGPSTQIPLSPSNGFFPRPRARSPFYPTAASGVSSLGERGGSWDLGGTWVDVIFWGCDTCSFKTLEICRCACRKFRAAPSPTCSFTSFHHFICLIASNEQSAMESRALRLGFRTSLEGWDPGRYPHRIEQTTYRLPGGREGFRAFSSSRSERSLQSDGDFERDAVVGF